MMLMSALLSAYMQTIPNLSKDLPIPSEFLDKFELAEFVLLQHFASCRCSVMCHFRNIALVTVLNM